MNKTWWLTILFVWHPCTFHRAALRCCTSSYYESWVALAISMWFISALDRFLIQAVHASFVLSHVSGEHNNVTVTPNSAQCPTRGSTRSFDQLHW